MVPELASSAETEGGSFGAFGTAGYRFMLGSTSFGPLVGLRYNRVSIDAYDESGAPGLDMRVDAQAADSFIGSAGLLATIRTIAGGAQIVSHVELSIDGDLLGGERTLTTALVTVPEVDRHLEIESAAGAYGRLSGGVSVELPAGIRLSARRGGDARQGRRRRISGAPAILRRPLLTSLPTLGTPPAPMRARGLTPRY